MTLRYALAPCAPAIILSDSALATFDRFRQLSSRDREAGGQLFARFLRADTIIEAATAPKWLDWRHRTAFEPNRWLQQRDIRRFRERDLHFVGDWHTHPEPIPRPSYLDLQNMKECFLMSEHELSNFLLIVVGTRPPPSGLYVALVSQKVMRLSEQPD